MAIEQIIFVLFALKSVTTLAATVSSEDSNFRTTSIICNPNIDVNCNTDCQEICGCERIYIYDEKSYECVLNLEYLKELTASKNYINSENDMVLEDGIANLSPRSSLFSDKDKLQERIDKVFRGIIGSAIFFMICCSICVISVFIFCCHIHRSDQQLKIEVDTLAKKMKVDIRKKDSTRKKVRSQVDESCNVVVQDANVLCV